MSDLPAGIASTLKLKGQRYQAVGTRTHVTRDGRPVLLVVWASTCASCGGPFETTSAARHGVDIHRLRRRCDACKSPSQPVRAR